MACRNNATLFYLTATPFQQNVSLLIISYTPLNFASSFLCLCLEDRRLALLLLLDLPIKGSHTPAARHLSSLSWLQKVHPTLALKISKSVRHSMAHLSQQMRNLPTTAPMGSLTMTSSCYRPRICSSWAFLQSLQQLCVSSEYTNPAVLFLTRFSKFQMRPCPRHECEELIATSALEALLQSILKEDSSWTSIHRSQSYS